VRAKIFFLQRFAVRTFALDTLSLRQTVWSTLPLEQIDADGLGSTGEEEESISTER
jgi:hypothetical protein